MLNCWFFLTGIKGIIINQTFWTAIGAGSAFFGALTIFLARKQLLFNVWLKAQEIFTKDEFTKARGVVLSYYPTPPTEWNESEKKDAFFVCRRMDEIARLAPYLGKNRFLKTYYDPLGKCWVVLEKLVKKERELCGWKNKWNEFEALGKKAVSMIEKVKL